MTTNRTVAIAGGGIVGRTLALALASQSHLGVRLYAGPPPREDARASAVAEAARKLFSRLGVWPLVSSEAEAIREMVITDSAAEDVIRPEVLTFAGTRDAGASSLMVPNNALNAALSERCRAMGIEETSATVSFFDEIDGAVQIELSDGRVERAAVLVAADGRNSRLRRIAGITTVERDYHQSGIAGTVSHAEPHDGRATQHFLPNGPLAMLPLAGGYQSSLVWTEKPAFAAAFAAMDPMLASLELERAFGLSLGRLCVESPVQTYPIVSILARDWVAGRVALAGDAAHVIHPLAGQGLNLGLRDVAALAETLIEAHRIGEDLSAALPRYERWRRADATQMALVTGGLNAIFSRRSDVARAMRSLGLGFVEHREGLKALFMREAAGFEGEVPRLMRGEAI